MDSIERLDITEAIQEPLDQARQSLKKIIENKETVKFLAGGDEPLEQICDSLECITKTMEDAQNGGSLTINSLKLDAENLSSNAQALKDKAENVKIDSSSKINIESLSLSAEEIRNKIINYFFESNKR